jgi:serine/threonine-protein kinase
MAVVYEVVHERLGKRFALKVLGAPSAQASARLEREARIIARLRHPHVVEAVDFGDDGESRYLVMELVEGETLAARLSRAGRLSPDQIAEIFLPVCSALAAAHQAGIVHRDLKPSNIMLTRGPGGRVWPKVVDFGVSKMPEDAPEPLTRSGAVIGTVSYLSPELARGARDVTGTSDVYSLGTILFECATGRLPFVGDSSYDVMHAIVTQAAPPPSTIAPDVPAAVDALVVRALERDRAARFESARALGRELLAIADATTRSMWEREFDALGDEPTGRTLPEEPAAAPVRAPLPKGGWLVAGALLIAAALAGVAARSTSAAPGPLPSPPPSVTAAEPVAIAPASVEPPPARVDEAPAPAPAPGPAARPPSARPRPSAAATVPSGKVTPARRGANGAPILE